MKNVVIVVDEKKCKEIEKFYSIYAKENKNEYILFFAKKEEARPQGRPLPGSGSR